MKKATLAGIGLVLIALFAGWYVLSKQSPSTSTSSQETTPQKIAFDSNLYGVAFYYLDRYLLAERDIDINHASGHFITLSHKDETLPQNGEGGTSITVAVFENPQAKKLPDFLKSLQGLTPEPTGGWDYQETTLAGKPALSYTSTGLYESDNIAVSVGSRVFLFSVSWLTRDDQILKDFESLLQSVSFSH